MWYSFIFFLLINFLFLPDTLVGQNAIATWDNAQKTQTHLRARYKKRTSYVTDSLEHIPKKIAEKHYKKGRLHYETVLAPDGTVMYRMQFEYNGLDATALNLEDSSLVRYKFTPQQKLRYYVAEGQSQYHLIYTYDSLGRLIRCKDCLDPFDNPNFCAVYTYSYSGEQLQGAETYSLPIKMPIDQKKRYALHKLMYNKRGQRTSCKSYTVEGELERNIQYYYKRKRIQHIETTYPKSKQKKHFHYHYKWNKLYLKKVQFFQSKDVLDREYSHYFNRKGDEVKRYIKNGKGRLIKTYSMYYEY